MALTRTFVGVGASGTFPGWGTGAYTTGSFTPPSNSILAVIVWAILDSASSDISDDLTLTDSAALTWTARGNVGDANDWSCGVRMWTAPVTTGVSMTVTTDAGAHNIFHYFVPVLAWTGYDTADPIGASVITAADAMPADGPWTITLPAAPASDSEVIGILCWGCNGDGGTSTPGTGWTELFDYTDTNSGLVGHLQVRGGSTSSSVLWNDVVANGTLYSGTGQAMAFEIKVAGAAPLGQPARKRFGGIPHMRQGHRSVW